MMRKLYAYMCRNPHMGAILTAIYIASCQCLFGLLLGCIVGCGSVYAWMCWQSNKDNKVD